MKLSKKDLKFDLNGSKFLVNFSFSFSFVAASPSEMCRLPLAHSPLRMVIYEQQKPFKRVRERAGRKNSMEIFSAELCARSAFCGYFNVPSCWEKTLLPTFPPSTADFIDFFA